MNEHKQRFETMLAEGRATLERVRVSNPADAGYRHTISTGNTGLRVSKADFDRLRYKLDLYLTDHGINGSNRHFECYEVR